jgi:tripartite-type tricarboxylate transporter receptor subunit TctC
VNPAVPARTVSELIALAKAKPGQLTFGSPGIGTPPHIAGELFKRLASIDITHVAYRGGGQEETDLVAGHISMSIEGTNLQLPFIRSGKLRPLAVTAVRRSEALPGVPTMTEAGVPGYEFQGWVGIAAPARTPAPVIDRLYREIAAILATREAREWFADFGLDPGGESPAVVAQLIRDEYAKWGKIIRDAGIKAE